MLIQCTKKLLDQLKVEPETEVKKDLLFSWHANLIIVNRHKVVVLVNDKNRYPLVLYGLKAGNFKKFDELMLEAIEKTFQEECINDEVIKKYLGSGSDITYGKTKNRSMVAKMNEACKLVEFYQDLIDNNSIYQPALSMKIGRYMVGDGKGKYMYPNRVLYHDLQDFSGESIFSCKAAVIKVTLDLENHRVWRRLIVPVNITFNRLHDTIQCAFGWKDYHLHEFYIYDDQVSQELSVNHFAQHKDNLKPVINLVFSEEDFAYKEEYDVEMKLEKGIKLSEYIPARMKYIYDYGDHWEHYIEIEKTIDDYDNNYPLCLEGEGTTPPEDVGGEGSYERFLEAIGDENHPEHEFMVEWGKSQGYKKFNVDDVNREIKWKFN